MSQQTDFDAEMAPNVEKTVDRLTAAVCSVVSWIITERDSIDEALNKNVLCSNWRDFKDAIQAIDVSTGRYKSFVKVIAYGESISQFKDDISGIFTKEQKETLILKMESVLENMKPESNMVKICEGVKVYFTTLNKQYNIDNVKIPTEKDLVFIKDNLIKEANKISQEVQKQEKLNSKKINICDKLYSQIDLGNKIYGKETNDKLYISLPVKDEAYNYLSFADNIKPILSAYGEFMIPCWKSDTDAFENSPYDLIPESNTKQQAVLEISVGHKYNNLNDLTWLYHTSKKGGKLYLKHFEGVIITDCLFIDTKFTVKELLDVWKLGEYSDKIPNVDIIIDVDEKKLIKEYKFKNQDATKFIQCRNKFYGKLNKKFQDNF